MLRKSRFGIYSNMNTNSNTNEYGTFYPIGLLMCYNNFFCLQKQKQLQIKNLKLIKNSPTNKPQQIPQTIPPDHNKNISAEIVPKEIPNNSTLMKFFNDDAL
jgi:hypothetical protein